jgi:hypothetical protein
MQVNIKRGSRMPALTVYLELGGKPVPGLELATVTFRMRLPTSGSYKVNAAVTIDDAAAGKVTHAWGATDTDTPGTYQAEWVVTYPDTKQLVIPEKGFDTVVVEPNLQP